MADINNAYTEDSIRSLDWREEEAHECLALVSKLIGLLVVRRCRLGMVGHKGPPKPQRDVIPLIALHRHETPRGELAMVRRTGSDLQHSRELLIGRARTDHVAGLA